MENGLIVYHSYGGNTQLLAELIEEKLKLKGYNMRLMSTKEMDRKKLYEELYNYDFLLLGSNTWGDGELPTPMVKVLNNILEDCNEGRLDNIITAVFGTGETGYRYYCNSVNIMRDILKDRSELSVTIKVEQLYSLADINRVEKFVDLIENRINLLSKSLNSKLIL